MEKLTVVRPQPNLNIKTSMSEEPSLTNEEIANQEKQKEYKLNPFGLPQRFKNKSLANYKDTLGKVELAKQTILQGDSLFISGPVGTGKTHLACGLMHEWYGTFREKGKPKLIPSVEFLIEIKETYNGNSSMNESNILDDYSKIPLLVIDDIGAENITEWSSRLFYTLIDRRYRNMSQTIFTSNLSLSGISQKLDERIASRIVEMGRIILLEGQDYRLSSVKRRHEVIRTEE